MGDLDRITDLWLLSSLFLAVVDIQRNELLDGIYMDYNIYHIYIYLHFLPFKQNENK